MTLEVNIQNPGSKQNLSGSGSFQNLQSHKGSFQFYISNNKGRGDSATAGVAAHHVGVPQTWLLLAFGDESGIARERECSRQSAIQRLLFISKWIYSVGFLISSFYPGETRLTEFKAESVRDARKMPWAGDGAGDSMWSTSSRRCRAAGHQTTLLNSKRRSSLGSLPNHAQQTAVLIGNFLVPFHLEVHPVHPFLLLVSPFWGGGSKGAQSGSTSRPLDLSSRLKSRVGRQ